MRDLTAVKDALKKHQIELPSWAFGNSGTRFKVFGQPGVPAHPVREGRRRRAGAPVHRRRAQHGRAHPVGQGRRLRGAGRARRRPRHQHRRRQRQRLPGRRLQARQRLQPRPAGAREGPGPPARVRRHHGRHRVAGPQAVVRRRHQLPRPGRHRGPPGPAGRGPGRGLRAARPRTSGCCWSTSCSSRRSTPPTCPTGAPACCTARPSAPRPRSWWTPATTRPGTNIEFIVAMLLRAGALGGFDFNSRFYADDDLMVGAADPFQLFRIMHEVVKAGALAPGRGASRSCSTSATTSSRRSRPRSAR